MINFIISYKSREDPLDPDFNIVYIFKSRSWLNSHAFGLYLWVQIAFKSIFWETLFLDQLNSFILLSSYSVLYFFLQAKFLRKSLDNKKIIFEYLFIIQDTLAVILFLLPFFRNLFYSWSSRGCNVLVPFDHVFQKFSFIFRKWRKCQSWDQWRAPFSR